MFFTLVACAIAGGLLTGAIAIFWDQIKDWLNNVAADFVEKHLGYNARQKMQKAVSTVNRVMNKIRNTSIVYSKRNRTDNYFDKTTIVGEEEVYEVDQKVLDDIKQKGSIVQEFEYRQ